MHQYVELTYCSTQDMNLSEWSDFTVVGRNGRVVVSGRKHEKPWSLFLLTPREDKVIREQVRPPCPNPAPPTESGHRGSEVLATSCSKCDGIKLINLGKEARVGQRRRAVTRGTTQRFVQYDIEKVFKGKKFHHLCLGEEDALYAESNVEQVVEIKTAGRRFISGVHQCTKTRLVLGYVLRLSSLPSYCPQWGKWNSCSLLCQ